MSQPHDFQTHNRIWGISPTLLFRFLQRCSRFFQRLIFLTGLHNSCIASPLLKRTLYGLKMSLFSRNKLKSFSSFPDYPDQNLSAQIRQESIFQ